MSLSAALNLNLHPRQGEALLTEATEVLYGGAAGSGKSHLMRVAAILWCSAIAGLQVYLFRRIEGDLVKNHVEGPKGFRSTLAPWVEAGFASIVEEEIRFWNGSKIYLCHCKDEKDRFKYQGSEMHVLMIDELTHFTDRIYRFLRGRVRAVGLNIPEQYRGLFPRILCGSNPGNIGHAWVKTAFVSSRIPMKAMRMGDSEGGMIRQYIPAKLADNPSMEQDDPTYRARLRGLGSDALVKAMEDGDWDVIEGAFFDNWSHEDHVLTPFEIPKEWTRFVSGDWGSAKPFSFGLWNVASDWHQTPEGVWIPRGAIIRSREWYGAKKTEDGSTEPDVGLKMDAEEVGRGLKKRFANEPNMAVGVLDPSAFQTNGGPSIAERMLGAASWKIKMRHADNSRVPKKGAMGGWDQLRARLNGENFGEPYGPRPMIYCFSTCTDSIRTIPVLQHDPDRPEDVQTDQEDHAGDEWRYACMSRPYIKTQPKVRIPDGIGFYGTKDGSIKSTQTIREIITSKEKQRKRYDD